MKKRFKPEARKEAIISAALTLAAAGNYAQVQRKQIADVLGVTPPTLNHHFGTMKQLRRDIMRAAVAGEVLEVIAQGLVAGDEQAKKAPGDLRRRALEFYAV